jgi:hypothetical protein
MIEFSFVDKNQSKIVYYVCLATHKEICFTHLPCKNYDDIKTIYSTPRLL